MSTTELERSVLDGKDRDELQAIAAAVGVRAFTRMRKAELVDAILQAAAGQHGSPAAGRANGRDVARRTIRSARTSEPEPDSVEALAAEEAALADAGAEPEIAPRPRRTSAAATSS